MKLKTTLLGKTYTFRDIKQVLAKANEEKTGDQLAGLAAESAQERVAAKVVLSALTLADLREHPAVPYESDEVTRIIQDDVNETVPQNDTAGSTAAGKRQRSGSGTGQAKNSTASDLHRKNLLQKTYRRGPAECQSREKVCGCSAAGRTLPGSKTQRTADGFDLIVTILAGFVKRKLSG